MWENQDRLASPAHQVRRISDTLRGYAEAGGAFALDDSELQALINALDRLSFEVSRMEIRVGRHRVPTVNEKGNVIFVAFED